MSFREMTPAALAALNATDLRLALFIEGVFTTGTINLWTGKGQIFWGGATWTGAGDLLGISSITESSDVVASGIELSLSGVEDALVSAVIDEVQQGLPGKVWLGFFDANGALIPEPVLAFSGRIDVPTLTDNEQTCTISITYENRLVDLKRAPGRRYTQESQRLIDPNDRGFEYVTAIQNLQVTWGR